ncbi:MAG: hypothetical protein WCW44_03570 [archaeon]|jgi:hypothetical protein
MDSRIISSLLLLLTIFSVFAFAIDDNSNSNDQNNTIPCVTEGQSMPVYPGYACCGGLNAIPTTGTDDNGAITPLIGASICSKCGNQVCEQWENYANCSADCVQPILIDENETTSIDTNETNPTDINESIPIACTLQWEPVCGVTYVQKECTCPTGAMCKCATEKVIKTYGNECQANAENATIIYKGECDTNSTEKFCGGIAAIQCPIGYACKLDGDYPDAGGKCVPKEIPSCPIYSPPYCPNGKIVSKTDERGCAHPFCDNGNIYPADSYKSVYFKCSNGKEFKESSDLCRPYVFWKEKARNTCQAMSTKCTVDSNSSTSGGASSSTSPTTGNFLLEVATAVTNVVAPTATTTNTAGIMAPKCIGGIVTVINFQVYDQCNGQNNECQTYENENGCITTKCAQGMSTTSCPTTTCLAQDIDKIRAIKQSCEQEDGQVIVKSNATGCMEYFCLNRNSDNNFSENCTTQNQIPEEKYVTCERVGGKLLTRFNDNGCLAFIECAGATKMSDSNASINKSIISDQTALLGLALKLETLRIDIQKTAAKTQGIADYYTENGDTNSAAKFQTATDLLNQAIAKIDSLKTLIRENVENFTEEQAITVKTTIKEIREEILKQVLLSMLA